MSTNGNTEIDKRLCFGERLAVRAIEDLVRQAQESNRPLRQRNSLSRGPVGVYARIIHELRTERTAADTHAPFEVVRYLPKLRQP
jgi:hypothetical protein